MTTIDISLIGYRLAAAPAEMIARKSPAAYSLFFHVRTNGGYFGRAWGVGRYLAEFVPGSTGATFSRCTGKKTGVVSVNENRDHVGWRAVEGDASFSLGSTAWVSRHPQDWRYSETGTISTSDPREMVIPDLDRLSVQASDEMRRASIVYPAETLCRPCPQCARLAARLRAAELLIIEARPAVAFVQSLAERPLTRDRAGIVMTRARSALATGAADAKAAQ